jgi:hypothetical protein
MTIITFHCEQGSADWYAARLGIPTASEFKTILGIKKDAREKVTRQIYLNKLAGEILTGEPMEHYTNSHMDRGTVMEEEARDCYSFMKNVDPQRVGFIRNGDCGCSPDSLIGNDGALEIKTAFPHIVIDKILRGDFPPEHKAQCQGVLWVAEREWIDIAMYWPKLPLFVKRAKRDEEYIKLLADAVTQFNEELAEIVERIRCYSEPAPTVMQQLEASVG